MSPIDELLQQADAALRTGQTDSAMQKFQQILSVDATHMIALYNTAFLYEQHSRFIEAAEMYRRMIELPAIALPPAFRALADRAHGSFNIFYFAGIDQLQRCRYQEASQAFLTCLNLYRSFSSSLHKPSLYYAGLCCFHLNDAAAAAACFSKIVQHDPKHVDALFNLGNAWQLLEKPDEAGQCYQQALTLEPDLAEAHYNLGLLLRESDPVVADRYLFKALQLQPSLQLPGSELCVHAPQLKGRYWQACPAPTHMKSIPIIINNRDRLSPLKQLIHWLRNAGYTNLTLLDNASTYPPLLAYYQELRLSAPNIRVVELGDNLGHQALWRSGLLKKLHIHSPFVYTDSDIVPTEDCPHDVLAVFWNILANNPFVQKVGFGLITDDLPTNSGRKAEIQNNELDYWKYRLPSKAPDQYLAPIDTTFALYRHGNYYDIPYSIRTGPPYTARHTDWYLDPGNLDEEASYYFTHADPASSSTKRAWSL